MNFQNYTLVFAFFIAFVVSVSAQNATVKGNLSDNDGAVAFADVFLKGENIGTTTDESGNFILDKLSTGEHIINFLHMLMSALKKRFPSNLTHILLSI